MKRLGLAVLLLLVGCGGGGAPTEPTNPGYFTGRWTSNTGQGDATLIIPGAAECAPSQPCQTVGWFKPDWIFVLSSDNQIISSELPGVNVGSFAHFVEGPNTITLTFQGSNFRAVYNR